MILAGLAILLTLILVVGLHEAGHALAARMIHVKIKRVSIGFGKPLIQWTSQSGCEWVWAIWPLGGYVELLNSRITPVPPSQHKHCFDKKPVAARLFVLIAGVLANLITAWVFFVIISLIGIQYQSPQIEAVQPSSISAQAGMLPGDQILEIGGKSTRSWQEVGMGLIVNWGEKDVTIRVKQASGELKDIDLNLSQIKFSGKENSLLSSLGISPSRSSAKGVLRASTFMGAVHQSNQIIRDILYFFVMVLKQLFSGVIPFSALLGPVGLFAASVASLTQGVVMFMYFIATFSLAVGFINLMPIPGLDGGSIVYAIIEKIRGKPVSVAMEVLLHRLALIAFCVLLVNLLMNDLQRFYS